MPDIIEAGENLSFSVGKCFLKPILRANTEHMDVFQIKLPLVWLQKAAYRTADLSEFSRKTSVQTLSFPLGLKAPGRVVTNVQPFHRIARSGRVLDPFAKPRPEKTSTLRS